MFEVELYICVCTIVLYMCTTNDSPPDSWFIRLQPVGSFTCSLRICVGFLWFSSSKCIAYTKIVPIEGITVVYVLYV